IITALVVGNEVLLRGEMTTADLVSIIRSVKPQVRVPVTYADVWEYWLKNRERMAVACPGNEILIGETGWPSDGRMRDGALPSRTHPARVVSEMLVLP